MLQVNEAPWLHRNWNLGFLSHGRMSQMHSVSGVYRSRLGVDSTALQHDLVHGGQKQGTVVAQIQTCFHLPTLICVSEVLPCPHEAVSGRLHDLASYQGPEHPLLLGTLAMLAQRTILDAS